ncbi:MAG: glycosyltransferase family 4 protein [Chitinophagales bacterium]|nr:glycosyltransferase family 4 protein [Chitinophagales bacterium]MDW8419155.1 glycosyltransferase family 4 protein [Chitinophagales bacterium]
MHRKPKCIVVYPSRSSFIVKDIEIIKRRYTVIEYHFNRKKGIGLLVQLLHQFAFLVKYLPRADIVYVAFSQFQAVLPALFCRWMNKRCYIMVGGTDAHAFPEFGYGNYTRKILSLATCFALRLCHRILPKHATLIHSDYTYASVIHCRQGYAVLCNNNQLAEKSTVIENGYDDNEWKPTGAKREKLIITTAVNTENKRDFLLKGIDLVLSVAPRFSDYTFWIIGSAKLYVEVLPPNVKLIPFAPRHELNEIYSRSQVYLQLSMAEGFPNALCEAMLCGCVPVVSGVFSMPEIVQDEGLVLKRKDVDELEKILQHAIAMAEAGEGEKFRQSIVKRFGLERRAEMLLQAFA